MTRSIPLILAIVFAAGGAGAAELPNKQSGTPIAARTLQEGYQAGEQCAARLAPLNLRSCFDGLLSQSRFTGGTSEQYEIGLAFRYWEVADMQAQVYSGVWVDLTEGLATQACMAVDDLMRASSTPKAELRQQLGLKHEISFSNWRRCLGTDRSGRP